MTTTMAMICITATKAIMMMLVGADRMRIAKNMTEPSTMPTTKSMKNVGSLKNGCSTRGNV